MEMIELQAMMIRAQQVQRLLRQGDLAGIDALAFVVLPPKAVEEASLVMAEREGISEETRKLFEKRVKKPRARVVTIEELACS